MIVEVGDNLRFDIGGVSYDRPANQVLNSLYKLLFFDIEHINSHE